MKLQISQIISFGESVRKVVKFIDDAAKTADPEKRKEMLPLVSAVMHLEQISNALLSAEVTIKS